MLQPSNACLTIIQECEGFSAKPYLCPAKVPTIGFGSTVYEDGTSVTLQDAPITLERAKSIMLARLNSEYVPAVNRYVQVPLTQNQFDALVDFAYNLGTGALKNSTLLRYINQNKFTLAAAEFDKWIMSAGKPLPGLIKRRALERTLFETK